MDGKPDDDFDPVADAAKLPLSDRAAHKHWKVRENAYRELATKFLDSEENGKIYTDFFSALGKIVRDANAPAQLAGFDAVSNYADSAPPQLVRRVATDCVKGIVEKGLAGRPANRQKAIDTFLMFVGADAGDLSADVMCTAGFKHRTPKVVVASVEAVTQALDTYGSSALPLKVIATKLSPLFNHSQEPVRNSAKGLITLLHRWAGDGVKVYLKDAKEVIIKEMEAVFTKNSKLAKPKPKKLTRSMEQRVRTRGGGEQIEEDDGFGGAVAEEEEVDVAVEINLMEKLGKTKIQVDAENNIMKDWFTAADSKKWDVRKSALDTAVAIIGESRLTPASHQEVFTRLRRILAKDANVNVVASASKLVSSMAAGLKKNLPPGMGKALMVDLFGRLKEKNRIVTDPVSTALDALHQKKCIKFYDHLDEITTAAGHKVPKARCLVLQWLGRCILNGTAGADLKGTPFKTLASTFVKATDDSSPEVRDAALTGIASLQQLVGAQNVRPYLEKLDKKRQEKVASILEKLPNPAKAPSANAPGSDGSGPAANTRGKAKQRASASSSVAEPSPKAQKPRPKKRKVKKPPVPLESDDEGESPLSPDAALAAAAERFEGFDPETWSVKSFKARGAAAGVVLSGLSEKESFTAEDISIVLGLLSAPPGLADSNFMAAKPKLELFDMVAKKCNSPLPRKTLKPLLASAMEKLGDIKSAKMTVDILTSFVEATSPRYFMESMAECTRETKNSRALIAMIKMAGTVVEDFGVPAVPAQPVASMVSANITNGAPAAKSGAAVLACKMASRFGSDNFRALLEKEGCPSEGIEAFDTEMQKYNRKPEPPTRKRRFEKPMAPAESEEEDSEEEELVKETAGLNDGSIEVEPTPSMQFEPIPEPEALMDQSSEPDVSAKTNSKSLSPAKGHSDERIDKKPPIRASAAPRRARVQPKPDEASRASKSVSSEGKVPEKSPSAEITPPVPAERVSISQEFIPGSRIFLELKNSNWKKRQDALSTIQDILKKAHHHIKPNVGNEIVLALRARLSDSNRNLATMAYDVVDQFIRAMGPGGVVYLKVLAPAILGQGCIDIKRNVREAAMRALDGCFETYGLSNVIPFCPLPLASLNAVVRKGFLEWLVPRLKGDIGEFNPVDEDLSCLIDPCLNCLRDKTAEVRHLAEQCVEQVIRSVGMVAVDNKVSLLSKAARIQLESVLANYRGNQSESSVADPKSVSKVASGVTPRTVRERPKSVAVPRTPAQKRTAATGDEENTPATGNRRQRPASARVTPVVATPDPPEGSILNSNNGRDARARRYMNKRLRFVEQLSEADPSGSIPPLIGEDIEDISVDLKECCSPKLFTLLTAPANRFRMHVEAIELVSTELEEFPDTFSSVADVLFRWAACRIEDPKTPPTVLVKLAGFVSHMCEVLMSSDVKLGDYEASAILPTIIEKVGSNRESVRSSMQSAILSIADVVEDGILLVLYTSCFRKPFSTRSHTEVSKEVCRLIAKRCNDGAGIPAGVLPTIGRIAGGEDDAAGRAAASCLERAHDFFGDDLWTLVGELSNEEAALLDVRLTSVINGMKHGVPSGTPAAEFDPVPESDTSIQPQVDAYYTGQPAGAIPTDICAEDFRLSVAPAPPPSVLTSISDSVNSATPMKTRQEMGLHTLPATPAPPTRKQPSDALSEIEQMGTEVLNRLHSPDRDVQLSGLATVFENLKADATLLSANVSAKILLRLVRCFGDTLERIESGQPLEDDAAVLKSFLKGVIRFAREPEVLRRLDQCSVEYLLSDALNAMIPQQVDGVEDWDQIRRGVNLMIVKVLESCDQNLLFTAMINLLLANIRMMQRSAAEKMPALAKSSICIKSIAKVAKRGFAECRIDALLRDIHVFLKANPVRRDGVSSSEDQTFAMRLLKTVVNAVIDEIGLEVLKKLGLIVQPEKSQLVQYVEMSLKEQGHPVEPIAQDVSSPLLPGTVKGQPSTSPVGVNQGGGSAGKKYASERGTPQNSPNNNDDANVGVPKSIQGSGLAGRSAGQEYLDRLRDIQWRYGLKSDGGPIVEKENGNGTKQVTPEEVRGKASSLRERMARIREMQGSGKDS